MYNPTFAPELFIKHRTFNVDFYINGLGATELRRFSNDDGSIHVSELSINGTLFHLHEEGKGGLSPLDSNCVSAIIGLFVDDVDAVIDRAITHGATLNSPAQDFDYGYRQGQFTDPFGHRWQIQKKV